MNLGVLGTGWITERFIDAARHDKRYNIVAVCSRSMESAKKFAEKNGIPNTFDNLDAMLDSGLINCMYVGTPNSTHRDNSIKALDKKIHVICEKPLAANAQQAEEMIKKAEEKGVVLMEAMRLTPSPVFQAAKQNLSRVAPVHKYVANFCQLSSKLTRFHAGEHFSALSPETAGGSIMDLGVYCVYPMISLFGAPTKVIASGSLLPTGVDGEASIICQYPDMTAVIMCAKTCQTFQCSEIMGEQGTIEIDQMATMRETRFVAPKGQKEVLRTSDYENDMVYECIEFADVVLGGKKESEINSHFCSLETMKVLDEARRQLGIKV
ncbi:Oxidoreductase family, NAD-binding Rossmann fold containing protein [Trichomonas vaginalis G3]|uniref:Oxidoreductase family, NAD-binding Rossmann fold containing protein n=2 Tax=Trichomonas vaginalis (strain ATCC PRA-98 / G3) TaxID=412133 RepID=A2EC75_TRIV3|nr:Oxidoreductase family, NAD-binding Rossmann fold containing protein [Trichomonas vaginalis G3]|eukprot:XP_001321975.1 Oxidoreductase family, NAD-binding Rossmann fold containing protein [Trichomonas vaginalis G3]